MKKKRIILLILALILLNIFAGCTKEKEPEELKIGKDIIEDAISIAIKSQGSSYVDGEVATEGHIILHREEKDKTIKVYTIASYGAFGFENGIFTKISGSGAIPTVIIFSKDEDGGYSLLEYIEPMDGTGYGDSIKKMFPKNLQDRVLSSNGDYPELAKQQEEQAKEYLDSIGITAEVKEGHVQKEMPNISVNASNILFSEITKYNVFLNNCPYWIGTKGTIEDGVRYIYETSQGKSEDGNDLIIFQKKKDGTIVEEYKYEIIGDEPILLEQN